MTEFESQSSFWCNQCREYFSNAIQEQHVASHGQQRSDNWPSNWAVAVAGAIVATSIVAGLLITKL